eukprot:14291.XXX_999271_999825_1 [CDS] Oithona nana genome sequencing.
MPCLKIGSYEIVRSQADADFYSQWFGKDMAQALVGIKATLKVQGESSEKVQAQFTHENMAQLDSPLDTMEVGKELETNWPHLGGKGIVSYKIIDVSNEESLVFETTYVSEALGQWKFHETYTNEGLALKVTKDDKTYDEFWKRV